MSSLFGSLSVALQAMLAQQAALSTTAGNIANVNTPGYVRQRPVLREQTPTLGQEAQWGAGVSLDRIESIRDRILELRMHQETQQVGEMEAFLGSMRQVEALFDDVQGGGLQEPLSRFFNSLQQLSTDPASLPARQAVLLAGQSLATAFRRISSNLSSLRSSLDREVAQTTEQVNQLTGEIAVLNLQVSAAVGAGQEPGAAEDRRTALIRKLAALVDSAVIDAGDGSLTITTSRGAALVVGGNSIALEVRTDPASGLGRVFSQGNDITAQMPSGRLGGLLKLRDQTLPGILNDLDQLADGLAQAVNTQHRAGFDLTGAAGGDFFVSPPATAGAAASLSLALSDPARLAASSDGTSGSNGNVAALAALRSQNWPGLGGDRPLDFYGGLVARIANDIANADSEREAEALVLKQLETQRNALSSVSLDEEAANLIRFQRAFEAAARVASLVNELTAIAINLGRA